MWLSSRLVDSPALVTLAQSLLLACGIVACGRGLVRLGVPPVATVVASVLVAWSPMVGAFSVSLWKDVPYAAVFLLASARTLDLVQARLSGDRNRPAVVSLTAWLIPLTLLRQNGLILAVALMAGLIATIPGHRRWLGIGLVSRDRVVRRGEGSGVPGDGHRTR